MSYKYRKKSKILQFASALSSCALLLLLPILIGSCGTVTDASALLHENVLYAVTPDIIGPEGPLTPAQAEHVIRQRKAHQKVPTDILERDVAFEQAISRAPLVTGNKVTLLKNGAATYAAMLAAIRAATNNINMEMYIFSDGPIGRTFADALIERQRHGVQVNLSYDSLGSLGSSAVLFNRMTAAGIAVMEYRPINPFEARLPWTFGHRDHRKMLVVDGRMAFTGDQYIRGI